MMKTPAQLITQVKEMYMDIHCDQMNAVDTDTIPYQFQTIEDILEHKQFLEVSEVEMQILKRVEPYRNLKDLVLNIYKYDDAECVRVFEKAVKDCGVEL